MTNRVIDIAERPAKLTSRDGLLTIEQEGGPIKTIPFDHIAALICSHPQAVLTQNCVAELASANGVFVVCNRKHLPVGMMIPLVGHGEQTTIFQRQAEAGPVRKKRLWREIVQSKIRAQAAALKDVTGDCHGLDHMSGRVKVGDAAQMEALASRLYWPLLFGDGTYRRSEEQDSRNALLNYGYAVVRAMVARAICGAGLHPGLGLHHHNRYDPYPLASDLMEPFRPLVDRRVARWCSAGTGPWPLDKVSKAALLALLLGRFTDGKEERSLFDWVERTAERVTRCIEGTRRGIDYPQLDAAAQADGPGPEATSQ